jgi:excisionase family DNA binding protein
MRGRRQPIGFSSGEPREETTPLFARIPARQAAQLDRLSFELKLPKQEILSQLIAQHLGTPVRASGTPSPLETEGDEVVVGRHSFRAVGLQEVLTLEQAAELLQVEEELVRTLAEEGTVPGRLLGSEWRFSLRALLAWLSQPEAGAEQPKKPTRRR